MRTRMKEAAALETEAYLADRHELAGNRFERQHTSAYVSIRQHTSAYVSIRQHTRPFKQTQAFFKCLFTSSAA